MNFQQKVIQAKELMQKIRDNGGTPYEPDTFHYDRDIGWEVHTDYDFEIAWQDFNYRSHETGLTIYRNLNEVIRYLRGYLRELNYS